MLTYGARVYREPSRSPTGKSRRCGLHGFSDRESPTVVLDVLIARSMSPTHSSANP